MARLTVVLVLFLTVFSASAQIFRGPHTRVPRGVPRVGTTPSGLAQLTRTHPEREITGKPFEGPIAFPPVSRQWIRIETPRFVLISAAGERRTRAIAEDLERLTEMLTRTSAHFAADPVRTRVFVFTHRGDVQPYFDAVRGFQRVDATGITLREGNRSTMLIDANARGGEMLTPRHELVHDLLRHRDRPLPLWLEEGLAEYYSNLGQPVREHVSRLGGRLRMSLDTMFVVGPSSPLAGSLSFYAQSWAAVSTLVRRDADAFFDLLDDLAAGTAMAEALQKRYRMSFGQLAVAMRKAGVPAAVMPRDESFVAMEVAPIDRPTLLSELGDMLTAVEGREIEAERHFRAALELQPNDEDLSLRLNAAIGLRLVAESDLARALPHLELAYAGLRENPDLAFALFSIYIGDGKRSDADALFLMLAASSRATDARRLLMRTDVARADALARQGNVAEAVRIIRELASKMPERARRELEAQAARLEQPGNNLPSHDD